MQVDELLSAIAVTRQRMMIIDGPYDVDQVRQRMLTLDVMRDFIRNEDTVGFTDYCQRKIAGVYGDMMCDLLDEMYEELGLGHEGTWDQFSNTYLEN